MPAATEAKAVSTSVPLVDNETMDLTQQLVVYDKMLEGAHNLKDEKAERMLAQCKEMCLKRYRGVNKTLLDELDRDMKRTRQDRDELRAKLRDEDRKHIELKRKAKLAKLHTEAVARQRKEDREALEQEKLRIDTTWDEKDYGQGLSEAMAEDQFKKAKPIMANYRVGLQRLWLRCPALPEHLQIQWDDFLQDFPITWLQHYRTRNTNVAGKAFLESVGALFKAELRWWLIT